MRHNVPGYFLGNCLFVFRVSEPLSFRAERFLLFRGGIFSRSIKKRPPLSGRPLFERSEAELALVDQAHGNGHWPGMAIS